MKDLGLFPTSLGLEGDLNNEEDEEDGDGNDEEFDNFEENDLLEFQDEDILGERNDNDSIDLDQIERYLIEEEEEDEPGIKDLPILETDTKEADQFPRNVHFPLSSLNSITNDCTIRKEGGKYGLIGDEFHRDASLSAGSSSSASLPRTLTTFGTPLRTGPSSSPSSR